MSRPRQPPMRNPAKPRQFMDSSKAAAQPFGYLLGDEVGRSVRTRLSTCLHRGA